MVGHVLGLDVRCTAMMHYVEQHRKKFTLPKIMRLKSGIYLFKFENEADRDSFLTQGAWFYGSRRILLRPWSDDRSVEKFDSRTFPIWIQLPRLNLNLLNPLCLSKIASIIGHPISTDKMTTQHERLAYARVLIEVTMPKVLPNFVEIRGSRGLSIKHEVVYEFYLQWCKFGKCLGHSKSIILRRKGRCNGFLRGILNEGSAKRISSSDNAGVVL